MEENSILDRVLESKQEREMRNFNPIEIISNVLKYISTKESDILRRRFGLGDQEKETLENIGKVYNVTRERIRQIERSSIKKIKDMDNFQILIEPMENIIHGTMKKSGGAVAEDYLLEELLQLSEKNDSNRRHILFSLYELLDDKFIIIEESEKLKRGWRLNIASMDFIHEIIEETARFIESHSKPLHRDHLIDQISEQEFYKKYEDQLTEDALLSYLEMSQQISRNPFDEYGLVEWGSIKPKRMHDKIYLILKREGKPLHFNKITELINEVGFDERKAYPPTIHNELILNDEYVLVGRGIYALKEWGYEPGVVADVLHKILSEHQKPLTKEELVQKTLEKRLVKKNTIHLALNNKIRFQKLPDGRYYILKEVPDESQANDLEPQGESNAPSEAEVDEQEDRQDQEEDQIDVQVDTQEPEVETEE